MAKHNRIKHRAHGNLPAPSMPFPVQNRMLRDHNKELRRVLNKVQRLLWMAVHQANGRIEMTVADYKMAMQMPDEDCCTSTELSDNGQKVVLIFTNAEGKRLPESEPKLVIATDG